MCGLARRQYSLITASQLHECGYNRAAIGRLVGTGRIFRVRPAVYQLAGVAPSWRSRALAAVLSVGAPAVLSHESAAALWGLVPYRRVTTIELTGRQAAQPGLRVYRRRLAQADRTVYSGVPVTTAARTLLDLSESRGRTELGQLLDEAVRLGITTLPHVTATLDRAGGRRLSTAHGTLRSLLSDRGEGWDPGDSARERLADDMWDEWGLPPSCRQYWVRAGGRRFRLDRAIPELKIGIEWNGRERHGMRSQFEYDMDRRNQLQAAGWRMLDFHYRNERDLIVETVWAVYEERRRQFGRAECHQPLHRVG